MPDPGLDPGMGVVEGLEEHDLTKDTPVQAGSTNGSVTGRDR